MTRATIVPDLTSRAREAVEHAPNCTRTYLEVEFSGTSPGITWERCLECGALSTGSTS